MRRGGQGQHRPFQHFTLNPQPPYFHWLKLSEAAFASGDPCRPQAVFFSSVCSQKVERTNYPQDKIKQSGSKLTGIISFLSRTQPVPVSTIMKKPASSRQCLGSEGGCDLPLSSPSVRSSPNTFYYFISPHSSTADRFFPPRTKLPARHDFLSFPPPPPAQTGVKQTRSHFEAPS